MKELINSVKKSESTLKAWRNNHNSQEWKDASKVNEFLTGIPLNKARGCECVEDLFFLIKRTNINQVIKIEMSREFTLKPGKVIMLHGCTPITDKATDEQLINLLKLSPAHISQFESYPNNWKEICGMNETQASNYLEDKETSSSNDESSNNEDSAQEEEEDNNSNDGGSPENEERKNKLLEMKNNDLKKILIEMSQELPKKANKSNLVDAILEAEAIG